MLSLMVLSKYIFTLTAQEQMSDLQAELPCSCEVFSLHTAERV